MNDDLRSEFLMHTGKCNTIAINTRDEYGRQVFKDQHGVYYQGIDELEARGTLKVYCPSFLPAFQGEDDLRFVNNLFDRLKPTLEQDIPFMEALENEDENSYKRFVSTVREWVEDCLRHPSYLESELLGLNSQAFDRSMILQDIFDEENVSNRDEKEEIAVAMGRLKTVYRAMAYHYAIEALADDSFTYFDFHLPDIAYRKTDETLSEIPKTRELSLRKFMENLKESQKDALSPDMFRFYPLLASIIDEKVSRSIEDYDGWEEFNREVVDNLTEREREVFQSYSKSMECGIPEAVFGAVLMRSKVLRKQGPYKLNPKDEAMEYFQDIKATRESRKRDFMADWSLARSIFKPGTVSRLRNLQRSIGVLEFVNAYIGNYKFLPWRKDDENFQGKYLPYALMKNEKHVLGDLLCQNREIWENGGIWFKHALEKLLEENPSLYAKWFIPILEDGFIDPGITEEAEAISRNLLGKLKEREINP